MLSNAHAELDCRWPVSRGGEAMDGLSVRGRMNERCVFALAGWLCGKRSSQRLCKRQEARSGTTMHRTIRRCMAELTG